MPSSRLKPERVAPQHRTSLCGDATERPGLGQSGFQASASVLCTHTHRLFMQGLYKGATIRRQVLRVVTWTDNRGLGFRTYEEKVATPIQGCGEDTQGLYKY